MGRPSPRPTIRTNLRGEAGAYFAGELFPPLPALQFVSNQLNFKDYNNPNGEKVMIASVF